jgi:hypothetical protein
MTVPLVFMVASTNYIDDLNGFFALHGAAWLASSFGMMWFLKRRYEVPAWVFRQNNIFCFIALVTQFSLGFNLMKVLFQYDDTSRTFANI